ncbi:MAG: hypothetical protein FJ220_02245 [Kiritimatiellaceae bacterium]|nr:hypothetical protein [Kiritimatiellaceae bacterium]
MKTIGLCLVLMLIGVTAQARWWTDANGERFEAEFVKELFGTVYFKTPQGKEVRMGLDKMQPEDLDYLRLNEAPEMVIDVARKTTLKERHKVVPPDDIIDIVTLSVGVEKKGEYQFDGIIKAEVFAIGKEVSADYPDVYRLVGKKQESFSFTNEVKNVFKHTVEVTVEVRRYKDEDGQPWGTKYEGYLVVLSDARGRQVGFLSDMNWAKPESLAALRTLKVSNFMDQKFQKLPVPRPTSLQDRSEWQAQF